MHATQPDVLCFLEAKIDSEKLYELQGFQEWTKEQKYEQTYCHWSECEEKVRRGCEGILILSKKKCTIKTGINHPEHDQQARVALLEFKDVNLLISYHPQGGFTIKSQQYRKEWEAEFTKYLTKISSKILSEKKFFIWAGDFNVNPHRSDWSERAFDPIKSKLPKGDPIGCRKEDQEAYEKMLHAIQGKNLGESIGNVKRTCFPNERSLTRNYGQRIDHVVIQNEPCNTQIRVATFDVLQEFGASRKNSSDHCPLQVTLTSRDEPQEEKHETQNTEPNAQNKVRECEEQNNSLLDEIKVLAASILQTENIMPEITPLSEAFLSNTEEDRFEEDDEIECYLTESNAFEDEPMPTLRGIVGEEQVRILIDSGAAISLMTKTLADKLCKKGHKTKEAHSVNIKVANGSKETIRETITVPIKLEGQWTNEITFFILQNLPFDILIGNPTLYEWQAQMEWKTKTISLSQFCSLVFEMRSAFVNSPWNFSHFCFSWVFPFLALCSMSFRMVNAATLEFFSFKCALHFSTKFLLVVNFSNIIFMIRLFAFKIDSFFSQITKKSSVNLSLSSFSTNKLNSGRTNSISSCAF